VHGVQDAAAFSYELQYDGQGYMNIEIETGQ
jgi:hypothetical protein